MKQPKLVREGVDTYELAGMKEVISAGVVGCLSGSAFLVLYLYSSLSGAWMPLVSALAGFVSSLYLERNVPRSLRDHHLAALIALCLGCAFGLGLNRSDRDEYLYMLAAIVPLIGMMIFFGSWMARLLMNLRWRVSARRSLTIP